jgi:YbbR domain-containing protein
MPFISKTFTQKQVQVPVTILGVNINSAIVDINIDVEKEDKATFFVTGSLTDSSEIQSFLNALGK